MKMTSLKTIPLMRGKIWGDQMTNWFDDDEDEEAKKKLKNDTVEFTDDDELGFEEDYDDEKLQLIELGIAVDLIDLYRSHHKNKNIFYGGKMTKQFFDWILNSCTKDQLWLIKEHYDKYPKKLQVMIDDAEPREGFDFEKDEVPTWKFDQEELIKLAGLAGKRKQWLKFMYELMPKLMREDYAFNDAEIEMITMIKEDLG